jgi:hypothetical protein
MTEPSPPAASAPIPPLGLSSRPEKSRSNPHNWQGIVAAILGLLGSPLLGVLFGVMGLRSFRAGTANNRGLALTGIVAGSSWFALIIVGGIGFGALGWGSPAGTTFTSFGDVKLGDCFADGGGEPSAGSSARVKGLYTIDCERPHYGEVYHVDRMTQDVYPGLDESAGIAEKVCSGATAIAALDLDKAGDLSLYYLFPTTDTWVRGHRGITCAVVSAAEYT